MLFCEGWAAQVAERCKKEPRQFGPIAIDGKDVRGVAKFGGSTLLNMVSAFDVEYGLVLYHKARRGDELEMTRELIEFLEITGTILTLDALQTLSSFNGRRKQSVELRNKKRLR